MSLSKHIREHEKLGLDQHIADIAKRYGNVGGGSAAASSGGGGVTTITGTANQVLANGNAATLESGAVILTLPQDIHTTATPTFADISIDEAVSPALFLKVAGVVKGSVSATATEFNIASSNEIKISVSGGDGLYFGTSNEQMGIGTNSYVSATKLTLSTQNATRRGLVIKGVAAQSVNLQEWRDSSNNVLASVSEAGVITGTWGGTVIGPTVGGTGQSTVTVGDLLYGSASNVWSKLADVAGGSYLRSGGVTTAPLWSTLILPNAITVNQIVYGSATNTYGASANLTFDGQSAVINTSSGSGITLTVSNSGTGYTASIPGAASVTKGVLMTDVSMYRSAENTIAFEGRATPAHGFKAKLAFDLADAWQYGVTLSITGSDGNGLRLLANMTFGDDYSMAYGSAAYAYVTWRTYTGADHLRISTAVNNASFSGLVIIMNENSFSYDPGTVTNPTLEIHSNNENQSLERIRLFHDQTDGNFTSAKGHINLIPASTKAVVVTGDVKLGTAGNGLYLKEGTNATMGVATLVAGTVVVSTTKVTASSRIFLEVQSLGTVAVATPIAVTARTAGTSFTISSSNVADTSVIAWCIVEPA